jgi:hypothetical protein
MLARSKEFSNLAERKKSLDLYRMNESTPSDAYFFGYGSLVNRFTHDYKDLRPARLKGWRRKWRHTPLRPVAYLTVVRDPLAEIDGLIAAVPDTGWAELDHRERAYDRVPAQHQIIHDLDHSPEMVVYSIPDDKHGAPDQTCPVLLSYIDVVVQGYLQVFGEEGARGFFTSTDGWDAPVLDDRTEPIYTRHQNLTVKERNLVDEMLEAMDVRLISDVSS